MAKKETKADRIYRAVFDVLMDLRVELARGGLPASTDVKIAQAMDKAARAAVAAFKAKGGRS